MCAPPPSIKNTVWCRRRPTQATPGVWKKRVTRAAPGGAEGLWRHKDNGGAGQTRRREKRGLAQQRFGGVGRRPVIAAAVMSGKKAMRPGVLHQLAGSAPDRIESLGPVPISGIGLHRIRLYHRSLSVSMTTKGPRERRRPRRPASSWGPPRAKGHTATKTKPHAGLAPRRQGRPPRRTPPAAPDTTSPAPMGPHPTAGRPAGTPALPGPIHRSPPCCPPPHHRLYFSTTAGSGGAGARWPDCQYTPAAAG